MKKIIVLVSILCVCFAMVVQAGNNKLADMHKAQGLTCADCHVDEVPTKKASARKCIECHGDMSDSAPLSFKDSTGKDYNLSPHDSHAGQIRCTLCHSGHEQSKLYCNTCHHTFQLSVP